MKTKQEILVEVLLQKLSTAKIGVIVSSVVSSAFQYNKYSAITVSAFVLIEYIKNFLFYDRILIDILMIEVIVVCTSCNTR